MARLAFLDHARGLVIAFVTLQHATQTYAWYWGGAKYFVAEKLSHRLTLFDGLFMWTDSFIMQALFLIAGMFVIPSLLRHGIAGFWQKKAVRIIIPWAVAVAFLAPMLSFVKHLQLNDPLADYLDYWLNEHFTQGLPQAGYWFLSYLTLLTGCAVLAYQKTPAVFLILGRFMRMCFAHPVLSTLGLCGLCAVLITVSDILYGTPYWSRLLGVFVARSNMQWTYILFFVLGLAIQASGVLQDNKMLERFASSWKLWFSGMLSLSIPYIWYCTTYIKRGAITDDLLLAFYQAPSLAQVLPVAQHYLPLILARTLLHGFLVVFQAMAVLSVLCRFTSGKSSGFWTSLGACSYGIYFFHEHFCVFIQYTLADTHIPVVVKWVLAAVISFFGSWILTKGLRRLPVLDRVFA